MDKRDLDQEKDDRLSAFTDRILEGDIDQTSGDRPPMASTVETLARVLKPEAPPDALRRRIHRSVAAEWRKQQPSIWDRLSRRFRRRSSLKIWAAAAAALTVLAIAYLFLMPSAPDNTVGTVVGTAGWFPLAGGAVLLLILVVSWLRSRR